jgi:uncharacterized protein (DUF2141 family)
MSSLLILLLGMLLSTDTADLQLTFTGLEAGKGSLNVALFPSEGSFPDLNEDTYTARFPVTAARMTYRFQDLPYGQYALAVYQDLNNNGKLDRNMWGVPKEPYAFSSDARAKWSAPTFAEAAFLIDRPELQLQLGPKTWREW